MDPQVVGPCSKDPNKVPRFSEALCCGDVTFHGIRGSHPKPSSLGQQPMSPRKNAPVGGSERQKGCCFRCARRSGRGFACVARLCFVFHLYMLLFFCFWLLLLLQLSLPTTTTMPTTTTSTTTTDYHDSFVFVTSLLLGLGPGGRLGQSVCVDCFDCFGVFCLSIARILIQKPEGL